MTLRAHALAVLAATTAVAAACTGGAGADPSSDTPEPVGVKVAYIQDGSIEDANQYGQPAFLGLKLALMQAAEAGDLPVLPEVVGFDTEGDPAVAAELAREIADDPAYVAAVAAPYWTDTSDAAEIFTAAGLPTLSLSGAPTDPDAPWFRLVAGRRSLVAALAAYARGLRGGGGGVCLAGDGSAYASGTQVLLEPEVRGSLVASITVDTAATGGVHLAASTVADAGCSTVLWTGFGAGAAALRTALSADVAMIGSDGMKAATYLELAGDDAGDTVVACACVDLASSTDAAAQRFIHDYQADYAIPPGVFAAEGWDAGGLLLRPMRDGALTREVMLESLTKAATFEGLAATYDLGDLEASSAPGTIHLYRSDAGRWVALRADAGELPVRTEGVLAVGSCRTGAPFAYRDPRGRLVGFDVELARALARRLGLALGWTRTSCAGGTAPVEQGRVDVLLTPAAGLVPGTPVSHAFFATRAAVVVPAEAAGRRDPFEDLPASAVVGVVPESPVSTWAREALEGSQARLRRFPGDAGDAYRALEAGDLVAVVDEEAAAWAAIEHRPSLLVASTEDTGAVDVMVVSATATDLLPLLDEALAALLEDGTYQRLFGAYLPGATLSDILGR